MTTTNPMHTVPPGSRLVDRDSQPPLERALRLSVFLTEREQEMYEALKGVASAYALGETQFMHVGAMLRAAKHARAVLARIEAEAEAVRRQYVATVGAPEIVRRQLVASLQQVSS